MKDQTNEFYAAVDNLLSAEEDLRSAERTIERAQRDASTAARQAEVARQKVREAAGPDAVTALIKPRSQQTAVNPKRYLVEMPRDPSQESGEREIRIREIEEVTLR